MISVCGAAGMRSLQLSFTIEGHQGGRPVMAREFAVEVGKQCSLGPSHFSHQSWRGLALQGDRFGSMKKFGRLTKGSPLRRRGVCSISNSIPVKAMKGARASELAFDGGVGGVPLAIAIRDLALSVKSNRGDVPVLKGCSLNVPEGQLWMLLGPNGCGKSTLLKAMAGLLRPNAGRMQIIGPRSFVFQNPDHQVVMPSAEADVAFGSGRFDLPPETVRKRVQESLEAVGMAEYAQRSVQTLSGGQKQRIAIAGALAESSRLLLLDELTTYLEKGDQIGVLEAVLKAVRGPMAVTALWVTHRLDELEYADGAAYMENGRVVLSGSAADVKKHIETKRESQKSQDALQFWTSPL